jgi:hypothetical protein
VLWREAPGEWNILEIVGHLADVERVFGYRALRIARADPVMWTGVEFESYAAAASFAARPLDDVVAELAAVRAAFTWRTSAVSTAGPPGGLDSRKQSEV